MTVARLATRHFTIGIAIILWLLGTTLCMVLFATLLAILFVIGICSIPPLKFAEEIADWWKPMSFNFVHRVKWAWDDIFREGGEYAFLTLEGLAIQVDKLSPSRQMRIRR